MCIISKYFIAKILTDILRHLCYKRDSERHRTYYAGGRAWIICLFSILLVVLENCLGAVYTELLMPFSSGLALG